MRFPLRSLQPVAAVEKLIFVLDSFTADGDNYFDNGEDDDGGDDGGGGGGDGSFLVPSLPLVAMLTACPTFALFRWRNVRLSRLDIMTMQSLTFRGSRERLDCDPPLRPPIFLSLMNSSTSCALPCCPGERELGIEM